MRSNSWFDHVAVEIPRENASNKLCELVSDEEYDKLSDKKTSKIL